jgi:flagellar protein FlbD
MIKVTRLNGSEMVINAELLETVEATPDTVLTTINNDKWVVRESLDEIVARVVAYKREVYSGRPRVIEDQSEV